MTDPDPETASLLQRIMEAGTVARYDLLREALAAAEERGAQRERAAHPHLQLQNVTIMRPDP